MFKLEKREVFGRAKGDGRKNKAVYTPPQSRTGGQERKSEMLRDGPTNRPTDTASSRVASPRLKNKNKKKKKGTIRNYPELPHISFH